MKSKKDERRRKREEGRGNLLQTVRMVLHQAGVEESECNSSGCRADTD